MYTNFPREHYADVRSDDVQDAVPIPVLNKSGCEATPKMTQFKPEGTRWLPARIPSVLLAPEVGDERVAHVPSSSAFAPHHSESAFPYATPSLNCTNCFAPGEMKRVYISDCSSSILSHACSLCSDSFLDSPLIACITPNCMYPVAHECEACGWRVCVACNIGLNVQKQITSIRKELEAELELKHATKVKLVEQEVKDLGDKLILSNSTPSEQEGMRTPPCMSPLGLLGSPGELMQSMKDRLLDLEARLSLEKRSKEQLAAFSSSIQKEFIQYKTDIEMDLESSSAEQVLLQSRLVEQSVLLADARARIDELTSVQRREFGSKSSSGLSQREAILINENNRLKEEVDSLKMSVHTDFDNWKRTVMKQVKNECIRYRSRLGRNPTVTDPTREVPEIIDDENERELDFLFDQVDWTGNMQDLSTEFVSKKDQAD